MGYKGTRINAAAILHSHRRGGGGKKTTKALPAEENAHKQSPKHIVRNTIIKSRALHLTYLFHNVYICDRKCVYHWQKKKVYTKERTNNGRLTKDTKQGRNCKWCSKVSRGKEKQNMPQKREREKERNAKEEQEAATGGLLNTEGCPSPSTSR